MNYFIKYTIFFIPLIFCLNSYAQLENVIVEKFYITDTIDATDTIGGGIEPGTTTYRIFIDLKPGSRLKRVYGDINHPIEIISTEPFFNNREDGRSFAKDFNKNRFKENTVALDSWCTIGQITTIATNFGLLKNDDNDGSIIFPHDGGSAEIPEGLLNNSIADIGVALNTADGIGVKVSDSTTWVSGGIVDLITGEDTTIFGSIIPKYSINSTDLFWGSVRGSEGILPDKNQVLIAQLTTKGELNFKINVEVDEPDGNFRKTVKYVHSNTNLQDDEIVFPSLTYPPVCGCTDPSFIEYSISYGCLNQDSCKTKIVLGCTDSLACNYNLNANKNVQSICCYPGLCNDRDLTIVCNDFGDAISKISIFPNPTTDKITVKSFSTVPTEIFYSISTFFGIEIRSNSTLGVFEKEDVSEINLADLNSGIYIIKFSNSSGRSINKILIKN